VKSISFESQNKWVIGFPITHFTTALNRLLNDKISVHRVVDIAAEIVSARYRRGCEGIGDLINSGDGGALKYRNSGSLVRINGKIMVFIIILIIEINRYHRSFGNDDSLLVKL
jgi:hypothetical protein